MKSIKKIYYSLILSMILALVSPTIIPFPWQIAQVEAAVKLNKSSVTLIKGQSVTLKITGSNKSIKWSSNKNSVATVSQKGKVVAKKKGTATITATIGKKKYTCKVSIQTPKLNTTKVTLAKGEYTQLKINGTNQKVTWSSSNKKVATVSKAGKVSAKKKGTVTITATVLNKKYTCKVTVKSPASSNTQSNASSGTQNSTTSSTEQTDTAVSGSVWIPTNGGKKYHSVSTCSGMVDPSYVTLEEAIALGFDACKKCH